MSNTYKGAKDAMCVWVGGTMNTIRKVELEIRIKSTISDGP